MINNKNSVTVCRNRLILKYLIRIKRIQPKNNHRRKQLSWFTSMPTSLVTTHQRVRAFLLTAAGCPQWNLDRALFPPHWVLFGSSGSEEPKRRNREGSEDPKRRNSGDCVIPPSIFAVRPRCFLSLSQFAGCFGRECAVHPRFWRSSSQVSYKVDPILKNGERTGLDLLYPSLSLPRIASVLSFK